MNCHIPFYIAVFFFVIILVALLAVFVAKPSSTVSQESIDNAKKYMLSYAIVYMGMMYIVHILCREYLYTRNNKLIYISYVLALFISMPLIYGIIMAIALGGAAEGFNKTAMMYGQPPVNLVY
jgi:uncharacterized Tic20 family protein